MEITVFTNGCFDIIHPGHVDFLERARKLGTRLVVGLNSDESVRKIKGAGRPVLSQSDRASILSALRSVDEVIIFDELTPEKLIHDIKPHVLVKGGDWPESEIIGADFVLANGGRVESLPLLNGFSTSDIISRMNPPPAANIGSISEPHSALNSLEQHIDLFHSIRGKCLDSIIECGGLIRDSLSKGGKILICGNGGSAADAQHIAAEFIGRYEREREALPAIALTTDTSALTALGNDYGFDRVFSRQTEALARKGDCLIAISTSGNSPNIIAAVMSARRIGCSVIGLTGGLGKKLASLCDACVMVPSTRTSRIQEAHITIGHIWCEMIDAGFDNVSN